MSDLVLVDTSVWIEVFRKRGSLDLMRVVQLDQIVTCLPVLQEVLQGIREDAQYRVAHGAMTSFPCLESPLGLDLVEHAIDLYRSARRRGLTVRSSVDCVIAACALRSDVTVLHRGRDYPAIAKVAPLRQRTV